MNRYVIIFREGGLRVEGKSHCFFGKNVKLSDTVSNCIPGCGGRISGQTPVQQQQERNDERLGVL